MSGMRDSGAGERYRILEHLGGGGMGIVYKAEDLRLKRTVALKFLPPEFTRDPDAKERFANEAQAASALQHPNICVIHDIDESPDGRVFIVMEYCDGETLKKKIGHGPVSVAEAVGLALQIAGGLAKAHAQGIVHRDVKPANIIITSDGIAKILDFGLAKLIGQMRLTQTGTTLGTVAYMSPEQARGGSADQRSDIWSLGVVLYEMLTGRLPFSGDFDQGVIYSILNVVPDSLSSVNPYIPVQLNAVVSRALEKDPARRYTTLQEMITDLAGIVEGATGRQGTGHVRTPGHTVSSRALRWIVPVTIVSLGIAAYVLSGGGLPWKGPDDTEVGRQGTTSITVLPLKDYSPDKDQAFFCNGIAEEIVTALSQIPELKIVSGTRAFALQEQQIDVRATGRLLGVASVLEGSVRKADEQLRITLQLVNVDDGSQIWTQAYDRKTNDVIGVQEEVARSVAAALQITLAPQTWEKVLSRKTNNAEAYEYFLRGTYLVKLYLVSYREQDIQSAVRMYEKAISLDSTYAIAYGGLAWAYEHRYVYGRKRNPADREQVVRAVRRGYELDPNSGALNAGMGYIACKTGDYDGAYAFFKRALSLDPHSLMVNHLAGEFLFTIGLQDRAERFFLKAIERDPYYLLALGELAGCYESAGDFGKAAVYYQKTLALSPDDRVYKLDYISFLLKTGAHAKAEEILHHAVATHPEFEEYSIPRALLFALRGEKANALGIRKNLAVYSLLNMRREALTLLEENAGTSFSYCYTDLLHNPFLDNLRGDSRFQSVLAAQKTLYEERLRQYGDL